MTTYKDFISALDYLVAIEPEPEPDTFVHMEEYDAMMAPHEAQMETAYATIQAYGELIAPHGLEHMQSVLYRILSDRTDPKAYAVIECTVNGRWNGLGEWRG